MKLALRKTAETFVLENEGKSSAEKALALEHVLHDLLPRSAVMVIEHDGRIVSVSRKGRPNDLALPGGKVEFRESPPEAAIRETREEVDVVVHRVELITAMLSSIDDQRLVYAFRATDWSGDTRKLTAREPETVAAWVSWTRLLEDTCSFRLFYKRLFTAFDWRH